jgi:RNA recognition motif-containing protein
VRAPWCAGQQPRRRPQHDAPPQHVPGYDVAFVGNIPWEINRQAVEDLFREFQPKFVRMFDDPATGKHRGFAHIHFGTAAAVERCAHRRGFHCLEM